MYLICSKILTFAADDASTVVSDIGDTLSPKYEPEIIAPAVHACGTSNASPIPSKATPIVATVVHDDPVITLTTEHITQLLNKNVEGVSI